MKKSLLPLACLVMGLSFWQCSSKKSSNNGNKETATVETPADAANIAVEWELIRNQDKGQNAYKAQFILKNNRKDTLDNTGWGLYFSKAPHKVLKSDNSITFENINGDFYRISPTKEFTPLAPGDSIHIRYSCENWNIKDTDAPGGLFFVFDDADDEPLTVYDYTVHPRTKAIQSQRTADDIMPVTTAQSRYESNEKLSLLPADQVQPIVPTPVTLEKGEGSVSVTPAFTIHYGKGLKNEADQLSEAFRLVFGKPLQMVESSQPSPTAIILRRKGLMVNGNSKEAYQLSISKENGIAILGSDPAGVFYGIQSLKALLPIKAWAGSQESVEIPSIKIEDAPRFAYRGMHLDVARNFQTKESVLQLLDLMSFYKLNKFHFHITDDEGWRLAIEELPELTEIGSKRGYTKDEKDQLMPCYNAGVFSESTGSGHYSREDFIEILQYANARHIEVIPEIDLPGHARAAIKAMEVRYDRLSAAGKMEEANKYRLIDPQDKSEYLSVQKYNDNVICVCKPTVYNFLETVVNDVVEMYDEAGVELAAIHTGGDEVPKGVWEKSPICEDLLKTEKDLTTEGLQTYFVKRFQGILAQHDLVTGGWEEVGLERNAEGHYGKVNPDFVDANVRPYIWNNVWGWGDEDRGYKLANAGYNIVLCNATNLYFDLSYNKDPDEPGYYWAGFSNTRLAYEFIPMDLFKNANVNRMGQPLNQEDFANKTRLTAEGRKHVLGIQGQLWSETVHGQDMMEYSTFPKLLGLAERAWAVQPEWATIEDQKEREQAIEKSWNGFANTLGQRDLHRLGYWGINYRLPKPGAIVENGELKANTSFPGLSVHYAKKEKDFDEKAEVLKAGTKVKENKDAYLKTKDNANHESKLSVVHH